VTAAGVVRVSHILEHNQVYKLDPAQPYTMPTCGRFRDPRPWESGGMRYGKVTALSATFVSDAAAVGHLLPDVLRLADEPTVTVYAVMCENVEWLAGKSYNIGAVDVGAVFDGDVDRNVEGSCCVVMWENMTEPILGGRDHSGVPKIYGSISDFENDGRTCRTSVSHFGYPIFELSVTDLTPLDAAARADIERAKRDAVWMNLKHFPSLENEGADVSYIATYPSSGTCTAASDGRGSVRFHSSSFEQNPTQYDVINLLAALPIGEMRTCRLVVMEPMMALDRLPQRLR
jgi:acetoacetate decarboxylase